MTALLDKAELSNKSTFSDEITLPEVTALKAKTSKAKTPKAKTPKALPVTRAEAKRAKDKDVYTTQAIGEIHCLSATTGKDGKRNTHLISFFSFFRTGTRDLVYAVSNCSDCVGWAEHGKCRHASVVAAILNHIRIADDVAASCEIVNAQIDPDSICPCGAARYTVSFHVDMGGFHTYHLCLATIVLRDGTSHGCMQGVYKGIYT